MRGAPPAAATEEADKSNAAQMVTLKEDDARLMNYPSRPVVVPLHRGTYEPPPRYGSSTSLPTVTSLVPRLPPRDSRKAPEALQGENDQPP
jgi:hypothetical protein